MLTQRIALYAIAVVATVSALSVLNLTSVAALVLQMASVLGLLVFATLLLLSYGLSRDAFFQRWLLWLAGLFLALAVGIVLIIIHPTLSQRASAYLLDGVFLILTLLVWGGVRYFYVSIARPQGLLNGKDNDP